MEEPRYYVLAVIKRIDWTDLGPDTKFSIVVWSIADGDKT